MPNEKKAAIKFEDIAEKKLSDISAADFIAALNAGGATQAVGLHVWPEKKKLELFTEPENVTGITVKDFLGIMAGEKKKRELEKPWAAEVFQLKMVAEPPPDPRVILRDPEFIKEIATEVARQIKG